MANHQSRLQYSSTAYICGVRFVLFLLLALISNTCLAVGSVYVEPSQDIVQSTTKVPAGSHTFYQVQLTGGAQFVANFSVHGGVNNKLLVYLLDEPNYQLYRSRQPFRSYQGTSGEVRGASSYVFSVPQTGRYYIVLDNNGAMLLGRTVSLYAFELYRLPTQLNYKEKQGYENLLGAMHKLFNIPDFNIYVRHCGMSNAMSDPNITMCRELLTELSGRKVSQAEMFVFMHELGHSVMKLWGYPLADNEDVADEFATVMSLMLDSPSFAQSAAAWWASQYSTNEALAKLNINDRHTISPQRARNIDSWLRESDDLLRRWQKLLVPNMTTKALQGLMHHNRAWVDRGVIQAELDRRGGELTKDTLPPDRKAKASKGYGVFTPYSDQMPGATVAKAVETAYPLMTAISIYVSEGGQAGSLPTDSTALGLPPLSSYVTGTVKKLSYDKQGVILLELTNDKSLGLAAGRKVQITLLARPGSVRWAYGYATSVSRDALPKLPSF